MRVTVDAAGNTVAYDDGVYPAEGGNPCLSAMPYLLAEGMLMDGRSYNAGQADARYKFTGKEKDTETGLDYFGARYYDGRIARWLSVDPLAGEYPSFSSYNYVANNPMIFVDPTGADWYNFGTAQRPDIRWRDGSDPQLKPGFFNWLGNLVGKGEYATSLGQDMMVAHGREGFEQINEATFELYLHTKTDGPSATIQGNTVPSDLELYGTIRGGLYTAELTTFKGNAALLINGGGDIPVIHDDLHPNGNPNNPANNGVDPDEHVANGIYFHPGSWGAEVRWTRGGDPISAGCQTGCYGEPASRPAYRAFMANFAAGWRGNYYLTRRK